tara:strand:+ start:1258 stop:1644 length:387 start_codon:yes stop_codon:yes gene_type:complete
MKVPQLINILVISFGSLIGANMRYVMLMKFEYIKLNKVNRILIINIISCFILGLNWPLFVHENNHFVQELLILFLFGFIGSLSTFSTFIYDLFELFSKRKIQVGIIITFLSIFLGLILMSFGFYLGTF